VPPSLSAGPKPHSMAEDAYALFIGATLIVLGLVLLQTAGLVTAGVAGIALLLSYTVPIPVGLLFTLINLPFFLFGWKVMGGRFLVKTLTVNMLIAAMSAIVPYSVRIESVHPAFAALAGGTAIGMGVLALARHETGVGGTGVVTLWLYKTRGWNAGRIQMAIDAIIVLAALGVIAIDRVAYSALSAIAINGVVVAWHRPGRYTGH